MLYSLLKPLFFRLEAERAHHLVSALFRVAGNTPLAAQAIGALYATHDPALAVQCAGLRFANPVGLAAGFDKRATLIAPMALLGFGHVEVGTVTPRAQPGNPQPRLFRLPEDRALINRLGFNSPGMLPVARRLRAYNRTERSNVVVGVNIGKNRDTPLEQAVDDYRAALLALAPLADYVTVNISSPNTPGLRRLHERAALEELLGALAALNRGLPEPRPLFLKISPDETVAQLDQVLDVAQNVGISGIVAGNTTLARNDLRGNERNQPGGLSGQPLTTRARAVIAHVYTATGGRVPVIGVGGVASAADAYAHVRAGASLIQLYTGLIYEGPGIAHALNRGLNALLRRDGFATIGEAVGSATPRV